MAGANPQVRFPTVYAVLMSLQSLLELYVYIVDYDTFSLNDPVNRIKIPLSAHLQADGQFSPSTTYYGSCGRASIDVQFRITSQCPGNRYGPQCTHECINLQRKTFCNYIGDTIDLMELTVSVKGISWNQTVFSVMRSTTPLTYATFNVFHRTTHLATIHVIPRVEI